MSRPRELVWTYDLDGAQSGVVSHGLLNLVTDSTLDGAETLTLEIPADDPKRPLLQEGGELRHRDTWWIIDELVQERNGSRLTVKAEAVARWTELANTTHIGTLAIADQTVADGGAQCLAGTGWTVGGDTADTGDHTFEDVNVTALAAVRAWARLTGTFVVFDTVNRTVDWVTSRGTDVGIAYSYGRNIRGLTRRHRAPTVTELWAFGAYGLTVAGITGNPYLEDYSWYTARGLSLSEARDRFRKMAVWIDFSIIRDTDLLTAAQAQLAAANGYETVDIDIVDISSITGADHNLQPGDTVRAIDPILGDELVTTVTRVQRNWLDPSKGSVDLSTSPQVVADPQPSAAFGEAVVQWAQFTGRIGGTYLIRNDGIWTLARVPLRFGSAGRAHMTFSCEIVGVGAGEATVWLYDATDDVTLKSATVSYTSGQRIPVTISAAVTDTIGRHDYRARITTEASGGPSGTAGVNVPADEVDVAGFWVMAQGAVQETPPPVESEVFDFTGAVQEFVVPDGVTEVTIECKGAGGGTSQVASAGDRSGGAIVTGLVPVTPGNTLDVYVGGQPVGPGDDGSLSQPSRDGGWPNGGDAYNAASTNDGAGGGGASFVAEDGDGIADARICAGGGGGMGYGVGSRVGGGGGVFAGGAGAAGDPVIGGGGATQFAGGVAATEPGTTAATAGAANAGGVSGTDGGQRSGGGGGGGRYGGGGGQHQNVAGDPAGGGGGGSGWIDPDVSDVQITDGGNVGHGQVTISWEE